MQSKKILAAIQRRKRNAQQRLEIARLLEQRESMDKTNTLVLILPSSRTVEPYKKPPMKSHSYCFKRPADKAVNAKVGCKYAFYKAACDFKNKLAIRHNNPFLRM